MQHPKTLTATIQEETRSIHESLKKKQLSWKTNPLHATNHQHGEEVADITKPYLRLENAGLRIIERLWSWKQKEQAETLSAIVPESHPSGTHIH